MFVPAFIFFGLPFPKEIKKCDVLPDVKMDNMFHAKSLLLSAVLVGACSFRKTRNLRCLQILKQ